MQQINITLLDISVCDLSWWHWLLAMLIPFLLGYLLRYFLNGKYKTQIATAQTAQANAEAELKKAKSMKVAAPVVVSADKEELNSLKDKVRDLETHNAKLKVDINEALAVKQQFAGINIDALNKRIADLESVEGKLTGDLQAAKSLTASLTANSGDLDSMKARLLAGEDEIRQLTARLNAVTTERDGIVRENDNINGLRNDIRDLSGKVGALTVENEKLKAQLATAGNDAAQVTALQTQLTAAQGESAGFKTKINTLEASTAALQADAAAAAAAKAAADKANADLATAKTQLTDAGIEAGNLRLRLEQLEAEQKNLQASAGDATAAKAAVDKANSDLAAAKAQLDAAGSEASNLRQRIQQLEASAGDAAASKAAVDKANSDLTAAKAQLDAASSEAGNLRQRIQQLEASAGDAAAAKAAADKANTDLAAANAEMGNLRQRMQQLDAESTSLGNENTSLRTQLADCNAARESATAEYATALAAAPAITAAPPKPDDLKIVEGIGPKIEGLFNDAGIYTWRQLSTTPVERLKQILHDAGPRYQMHDPATWPEQAGMAADGKFDELKVWQDQLSAGKNNG